MSLLSFFVRTAAIAGVKQTLIVAGIAFIFCGCNGAEERTSSRSPDSTGTGTLGEVAATGAGATSTKTIDSRLDILTMRSGSFDTLMLTHKEKKIVFKHAISAEDLGDFTLSVWPEKSQRYEFLPVYLSTWLDSKVDLGDTAILFGDQKMVKQQATDISKAIKDSGFKWLVFVPVSKPKKYPTATFSVLYYDLFLVKDLATFGDQINSQPLKNLEPFLSLNPSPPATALDNDPL